MSIRAVIVSNIRLYRDGLKHVLCRDERIGTVRTVAGISGALRACAEDTPDIVLLDLTVPDALGAIHTLVERSPTTKVIALGVADAEADITAYAEAGVSGYVFREGSVDDLVTTVVSAARGELQCSPRVAAALLRRVATLASGHHPEFLARLTRREREIARLIEDGLSNKEIAVRLQP